MNNCDHTGSLQRVVQAAKRYRDIARVYLAAQVALVEQEVTLDELFTRNLGLHDEVIAAELNLFAEVDKLDGDNEPDQGDAWGLLGRWNPA